MYKSKARFTRDQLVFVAETILVAALDRIESCQPTASVTWEERQKGVNELRRDASQLNLYESGALETAGMALAVFYAQLCEDGMGVGDALCEAGNFQEACENWVEVTWRDGGEAVENKMKELGVTGWEIGEAYTNYPDCHVHAECFVDEAFSEYMAKTIKYVPIGPLAKSVLNE